MTLARRLQNEVLVSMLYPKFKSVESDIVAEVDKLDFMELTENGYSFEIIPTKKVLKVTGYRSYKSLIALLNSEQDIFRFKSLCAVIFEIIVVNPDQEPDFLEKLNEVLLHPLIVQVSSGDKHLWYFKDGSAFRKVKNKPEHLLRPLTGSFDFELVCNLRPESFFNKNLLDMVVNIEEDFEGARIVDYAVQHNDLQVLKFLSLFNPNLETLNGNGSRVLEVAAKSGTVDALRVLLDVPEDSNDFTTHLRAEKLEPLQFTSLKTDQSLLMIASSAGNSEMVDVLLTCLDGNFQNGLAVTASDLAWQSEKYEIALKLINNDGPYPKEFDRGKLGDSADLQFIDAMSHLHKFIETDDRDEIEFILQRNQEVKHGYNSSNRCALSAALETGKYELHAFLQTKGFTYGIDHNYLTKLRSIDRNARQVIHQSSQKFQIKDGNVHITTLLAASRVKCDNDTSCFEKIKTFYHLLNDIPEVRWVLKVVASESSLSVVFDFNHETINKMDLTADLAEDCSVFGRTYFELRCVYIAAKRDSDAEIMATLAHELTHLAIGMVYNNSFLPFYNQNTIRRTRMIKIVKAYEKISNCRIIEDVYGHESMAKRCAELIVRPVHLMTLFINDQEHLKKIYSDLFNYFENFVIEDFKTELPLLQLRPETKTFNRHLEVFSETEAHGICCNVEVRDKKVKVREVLEEAGNVFIETEVPEVTLLDIIRHMQLNYGPQADASHIFIAADQVLDHKHHEMLQKLFFSDLKPKILVIKRSGSSISLDEVVNALKDLKIDTRLIFIGNWKLSSVSDEFLTISIKSPAKYCWNDLDLSSQESVLQASIDLQGYNVPLNQIFKMNSTILEKIPLEDVLAIKHLKISNFEENFPLKLGFFVNRAFKQIVPKKSELSSENVIEILESSQSLLLTDVAGMGKTTYVSYFAKCIKQRNPSNWVVFIDLKQHTDAYYKDDDELQKDTDVKFIGAQLLRLKSELELKLFQHFIQDRKLVFVIDGFDEISPDYKQCVFGIMDTIEKSKNWFLVTSRTHLCDDILKMFDIAAIKLQPLSLQNRTEILVDCWNKSCRELFTASELEKKAHELLEKFEKPFNNQDSYENENTYEQNMFESPLQVQMLAEICGPQSEGFNTKELDFFSLYERFVRKKINLWITKGPIAIEDNTSLHMSSFNVRQVHQKAALDVVFGYAPSNSCQSDDLGLPLISERLSKELASRVGLLQISENDELVFGHRTFAEYFVADFIIEHITRKTLLSSSKDFRQLMYIFFDRSDSYEVVLKFMSDRLQKGGQFEVNEIQTIFVELLYDINFSYRFTIKMAKLKFNGWINFFFKTPQFEKPAKLRCLLSHPKALSKNILFGTAVYKDQSVFNILWDAIRSFTNENEQKQFLLLEAEKRMNILSVTVSQADNDDTIRAVLEAATDSIFPNPSDFERFLKDAVFSAASGVYPSAFKLVWEKVVSTLPDEHQKEFFYDVSGSTIFMCSVHSLETLPGVLEIMKKLFNHAEMNHLINAEDISGDTVFHSAVRKGNLEVYNLVWDFIDQTLEDKTGILLKGDSDGHNLVMKQMRVINVETVFEVLKIARTLLADHPGLFLELLQSTNFHGENILQIAVDSDNFELFLEVWLLVTDSLGKTQVEALLNASVEKYLNVVQRMQKSRNQCLKNKVQQISKEYLLVGFNMNAPRVQLNNFAKLEILYEKIKKPDESIYSICFWLTHSTSTVEESGIRYYKTKIVATVQFLSIQLVTEVLNILEKADESWLCTLLIDMDRTGVNAINSSLLNQDPSVVELLWSFMTSHFDNDKLEQKLFLAIIPKNNFLHQTAMTSHRFLLQLLEWIKNNLGLEKLESLLRMTSSHGTTFYHILAQYTDTELILDTLQWSVAVFGKIKLREMIGMRTKRNNSFLEFLKHREVDTKILDSFT